MIEFDKSLQAWGSPHFKDTLKQEIEQLDSAMLPLQQGLSQGNNVVENSHSAMILSITETDTSIHAKTGIFFTGLVTGCHCSDDPSPDNELPEYCELMLDINKDTAETNIALLMD